MATYNMKTFEKKIKKWGKNNPKAIMRAFKRGTELVRGETVRKHLSGPKMAKGKGSLTSATLARRSGDLAGSINTKVFQSGTKIAGKVGTPIKYSRIHEKGGTSKRPMPKRPFLQPSLEKKRPEIVDIISRAIIEEYKRS